jgi:hypothetical protein
MGGIGFKFVMLFRFHGSEKLTVRKSLSWHEKGNIPPSSKLR